MELYRPQSLLKPGQQPQNTRPTVADAGRLMLRLQALDEKLRLTPPQDHPNIDLGSIVVKSGIYVNGSENLFQLVKKMSRPDLIPEVYYEAYTTVLQRRPYVNHHRVSEANKGNDPTFSEIWRVLSEIDALCGTRLHSYIQNLNQAVNPFPFLRLPAELRLQVYSHLLPREAHIPLVYTPHHNHQPPRLNMDIMRVNRQLHDEVTKYFYKDRTLWMIAARDKDSLTLSNEFVGRFYETVVVMNPQTRLLFKKLEIQVGVLSAQTFLPRRYYGTPSVNDHMRQIFALLPSLEIVLFTFKRIYYPIPGRGMPRFCQEREQTLQWILDSLPQPAPRIQWDFSQSSPFWDDAHEQALRPKLEGQVGMEMGESVLSRLGCLQQMEATSRGSGRAGIAFQ